MNDILAGGGPALTRFRQDSTVQPAAVNLCGSLVASGALTDSAAERVLGVLTADPGVLAPASP